LSDPAPPSNRHGRLARLCAGLRRLIGAPDYEQYLVHVRRCHPDLTPMSPEDFLRDAFARRYDRPGSRCC
jgi:uncharacterized short protein YbdD (DUF466 family)